ncbi:hypothetical protein CU098_007109 [Rhizopus stolonifer]|uniref:Uncharacterized protein n=1 Tax=Rhizopus stolonifer TaxID=4846 RepID=A0A367KU24_RHIST|nr:hypothetical protein CU098_007109 [Rhizopus stolonifer]
MQSLQDAINQCISSCSQPGGLGKDTCTSVCNEAAKCTDQQCVKDIFNKVLDSAMSSATSSATVASSSSSIASRSTSAATLLNFNSGFLLLFVFFTVYLINKRHD